MKIARGLIFKVCQLDGNWIIYGRNRIEVRNIQEDATIKENDWIIFAMLFMSAPIITSKIIHYFRDDLLGQYGIFDQLQALFIVLTPLVGFLYVFWYVFRMLTFRSCWRLNKDEEIFSHRIKCMYLFIEKNDDPNIEDRFKLLNNK